MKRESGYYWIMGETGRPVIAWYDRISNEVATCWSGGDYSAVDVKFLGPVVSFEQTAAILNK